MRHPYLFSLLFFLPVGLFAQLVGDTENGLASYFSEEYDGAETAYNVIYHKEELVAAHRQYAYNSRVRVKNIENGQTVTVRIIDQGPFIRSRIIELSERAAAAIGLLGRETVPVELTLISAPGQQALAETSTPPPPPIDNTPQVPPAPTPDPAPAPAPKPQPEPQTERKPETKTSAPTAQKPGPKTPPSRPVQSSAREEVKALRVSDRSRTIDADRFAPGLYQISLEKPAAGSHGVQVGSFRDLESAMDKVAELQSKWFDKILLERINTGKASVFKVIMGPFGSLKSAQRYTADLKKRYKIEGFPVPLQ